MNGRQLLFNFIEIFTSTHKVNFYTKVFDALDLSDFPNFTPSNSGPIGYPRRALLRAFFVMKFEKFGYISDLVDYLNNNLIIAHLCGFDISKPLPSYWTFERFIKNLDNTLLKNIMRKHVNVLKKLGIIDGSFVSLDSTPIYANTKLNNPKSFTKDRFSKSNPPKSDKDCKLGVRTANNANNNKKYEFFWGYKNHVLSDPISGLPIAEITTTADVADSSVAIDILRETNEWFSLVDTYFIADKAYDVKDIYNFIRQVLKGHAFIPLNLRNSKKHKQLPSGHVLCDAGLAMHKDGKQYFIDKIKYKFSCPFKNSKNDNLCPCNHPNYFNGKKNRGCTKYITVNSDYRSSINRNSVFFKKIYALRTESERYNSRWKNLNLEKAFTRNFNSISNLNTIGHICLLTLAIAAINDNHVDKSKSLVGFKTVA
ncbi:transposase [Carboxydothermus ferrireducens]|uniref:Transposase n=2 Tax=Carboxydothermus TaxID=129957 RepID=A0ABX2RAW5_9THEO|nr:transposase [Carboxydothermus ferrireducens]NYE56995.1 transposase [Carboxydothermus ferrireducens DSM 11255]NYE58652.1 transposase [Carboxydothermus ferrireducens DSM 11255]